MPPDRARELADIEALIERGEDELKALKLRLERSGRRLDPTDPFDPVGCLELWLAALRERRAELLRPILLH